MFDSNKSFNCNNCVSVQSKRQSTIFEARSCRTVQKERVNFIQNSDCTIEYMTCVGNFCNKTAEFLISTYQDFKNGHLPESGGLYDQPAKLVEIFQLLYSLESKHQQEEARKQKSKTRK